MDTKSDSKEEILSRLASLRAALRSLRRAVEAGADNGHPDVREAIGSVIHHATMIRDSKQTKGRVK